MRTLYTTMLLAALATTVHAQEKTSLLAVRGQRVHTVAGPVIEDGVVLIENGKIKAVGRAGEVPIPEGTETLRAKVVTPGFVDAHSVVGLAGHLNQDHDQDQLDRSKAMQPGLRAIDAYNARERLVGWLRSLGVTTLHTGHAPGALISGQTMIVKTTGDTIEEAVRVPFAMLAATVGESAQAADGKSPGTRGKVITALRQKLVEARSYADDRKDAAKAKTLPRKLDLEVLGRVLAKEIPLLVTAHTATDITTALRLQTEFGFRLVLDGASEAHLLLDALKKAKVPIIAHPTMARTFGERKNASFELGAQLKKAGIPFAFQSGYESYVPKTRCVIFEAAIAAAHGLGPEAALQAATLDAAKLLGIGQTVGSLTPGKDADLALFDGDPFEYATHCVGVVIDGKVVSRVTR
ncbi:MAG: amidohydrolase [Planctomycetes bacterium]|nr:amidohydrolase [Planctomycetota bacterium]